MRQRFLIIGGTAVIVLALLAGALYFLGGRGPQKGPTQTADNGVIARIQRGISTATGSAPESQTLRPRSFRLPSP